MAQQNTTVDIVDIQINYQNAVRDIATYRENIKQLQTDQERLKEQLKAGEISQREYDKAIAATNINLKNQKDAMRALEKQVLNQVRETQRQEGSLQQLRAQLSNATKAYDEMSRAERQGAKGQEMLQHINKITRELKQAEEESQRFYRNVGNYPSALQPILGSLGSLSSAIGGAGGQYASSLTGAFSAATKGGGMFMGVLGAVTATLTTAIAALKGGVSTAKQFEKAGSGLAAVLGVNKEQMTMLTEQARELGATTRYTATEVTQLQTELAKLGYSQNDIKNMTKDVLAFAQATGSELAEAASLAGAALRMFEDDTTHTQEYVDKMAAACTNSALDFNYLSTAMATVSPVANAFGFHVEDVLSLLGQLANAGFDASSAATATRNILLNLADANGDLAKSLGAPVTDLKGLTDGLRKLDAQGINLAESLQLTDKRSVAAFNTFLKTADGADKLKDTLNDANGAAQEMANTMGDNLEGDLASLGSAWDDFMIEINNGQEILRSLVQRLTDVVKTAKGMYVSIRTYFSELYERAAAFRTIIALVGTTFKLMWDSGKSYLQKYADKISALGTILEGAFTFDWDKFHQGLENWEKAGIDKYKNMAKAAVQDIADMIDDVTSKADTAPGGIKIGTRKRIGNWICEWDGKKWVGIERVAETSESTSGKKVNTGAGIKSDKQRKAEEAAANKAATEQRKREDVELKAVQEYNTQLLKLMGEGLEARRAQTAAAYDGEIARLEKQLHQKQNLTATAEDAIRKTIELKRQERDIALSKLEEEFVRKEIDKRVELLEAELNVTQSKTYERFNIQRKIEQEENAKRISEYNSAQAEELQGVETGSQQALEIEERYNQLRELSRQQMWQNIHEIDREQQDALNANRQQILQNELAQIELENSQKLELQRALSQLDVDVVTEGEMEALEKRKELAELKLAQIREQGQLEGETLEEYRARELAAEKEKADASIRIDDAVYKNKQAYTKAMGALTDSLIGLVDKIGESNAAFAKLSKIITLAQIAIDTGKALSAGIASASGVPFPGNLAAIATTVATILANVTTAISTVKSAKFARGGVNIHGAGTGTSDSIPAMISNGESVINAKATRMFAPLLEAMNAIGNGVALPATTNYQQSAMTVDMMSDAFANALSQIHPVVSVEEISDVQNRVKTIQSLDTL